MRIEQNSLKLAYYTRNLVWVTFLLAGVGFFQILASFKLANTQKSSEKLLQRTEQTK